MKMGFYKTVSMIGSAFYEEIWEFGILKSSQIKMIYLLLAG